MSFANYDIYDKYDWFINAVGEYDALDELFRALPDGGVHLEKMCIKAADYNQEPISGDLVTWWLKSGDAFEVLFYLIDINAVNLEYTIDILVNKYA